MSSITTEYNAPRASRSGRPVALRAADGVIAGYIRSLAQAAAPLTGGGANAKSGRLAAHAYACGASRASGLATRRRPALRRAPLPA